MSLVTTTASMDDVRRAVLSSDMFELLPAKGACADYLPVTIAVALRVIAFAALGGRAVQIDLDNGHSLHCILVENPPKDGNPVAHALRRARHRRHA